MNKSSGLFVFGVNLLFFSFFIMSSCQTAPELTITGLECEYLTNPMGVDVEHPGFSWKIISDQRGVAQMAYQIIVGNSFEELDKKAGKNWDSGKVQTDLTNNVEYKGVPLQSNKDYYWKVCVWLNDKDHVWSEPAVFHAGLLKAVDWKAKWITTEEEIIHQSPLLRKSFQIGKTSGALMPS